VYNDETLAAGFSCIITNDRNLVTGSFVEQRDSNNRARLCSDGTLMIGSFVQ